MRKTLIAAAAVVALAAFSAPASAATLVMSQNGSDLAEVIHSNGTQSGTSLNLVSSPSAFTVNFSSSDSLSVTGNGVAQVHGTSGGFTDVTITAPTSDPFTAFKFNLGMPSEPGYSGAFTFDAMLTFVGGGTQFFDNFAAGDGNGANRFTFTRQGTELIDQITLSDLEAVFTKKNSDPITGQFDFDTIKQASFNFAAVSGVPEPATWAEFILGFGVVGVGLRRRRSQAASVVPA
jgi:hypothetical protein